MSMTNTEIEIEQLRKQLKASIVSAGRDTLIKCVFDIYEQAYCFEFAIEETENTLDALTNLIIVSNISDIISLATLIHFVELNRTNDLFTTEVMTKIHKFALLNLTARLKNSSYNSNHF